MASINGPCGGTKDGGDLTRHLRYHLKDRFPNGLWERGPSFRSVVLGSPRLSLTPRISFSRGTTGTFLGPKTDLWVWLGLQRSSAVSGLRDSRCLRQKPSAAAGGSSLLRHMICKSFTIRPRNTVPAIIRPTGEVFRTPVGVSE